jgi:hypothetical protein
MSARAGIIVLSLAALGPGAAACRRPAGAPPPFTSAVTLGGRNVAPAALEHGREVYTHFCRPCHGDAGDGKGPAAAGLRPPPRDLRLGVYKFAAVPAGQLPHDADFVRTLRRGLHGTAMLAWDVPDAELDDLIQYTKAFAPRWRTEQPGEVIVATPDPWQERASDAIERGRRVYHGLAQCATACHPAYTTKPEIYMVTKELTQMEVREMRADLYFPVAKDSDYGVKILPPDFTFNELRGGETLEDIYRAIAAGIGGTAMPTWKNVLPEPDLWAMTYYVRWLIAMRGTPEAAAQQRRLLDQAPWEPPPLPVPDAGAAGGDGGAARARAPPIDSTAPEQQPFPPQRPDRAFRAPPTAVMSPRPGLSSTLPLSRLTLAARSAVPRSRPRRRRRAVRAGRSPPGPASRPATARCSSGTAPRRATPTAARSS